MGKLIVTLVVVLLAAGADAARTLVDPPVKVQSHKKDKSEIAGEVVAFDDDGFDIRGNAQLIVTVAWKDLEAKENFEVHETLFTKASGADWLSLAQKFIALPGGKPFAEQALVKAIKLDPTIKSKVEQAVRAMAETSPSPTPSKETIEEVTPQDFPVTEAGAPPAETADKNAWPPLTEGQMAAAVKVSKAFAEAARVRTKANLVLYETKFFLFYSDLPNSEAESWVNLLDRMYGKLAKLFGISDRINIWRGKAVIFVFSEEADFKNFEKTIYFNARTAGYAGFCHPLPSGDVHITFFKQREELNFAHVLVHESVHGFLHRFRTQVDIPSWVNEGLAETIASDLVPQRDHQEFNRRMAVEVLRRRGIGDLLTAKRISTGQYEVAQFLCEYMIREDRPGYVAFINAIKDGMSAMDALEQKYGERPSRMISSFGESMGVDGLTLDK